MGEGGTDKKTKPLTKAQRAIVNAGTEIRLDRASAEDAAYLGVPLISVPEVPVEIIENYRDRGRQPIDMQCLSVTDFERDGILQNQRVTSFRKAPKPSFFEILSG